MARDFLREGRRLFLRGLHLLGSRTAVMIGLMLAIVTGIGAARNLWLLFTGSTASGVVVRQIEELSADWSDQRPGQPESKPTGVQSAAATRLYRAVVDFSAGGQSYEIVASTAATARLYPTGTKVDVLYPRGRPERATLKAEAPGFWPQAGLLFVATVLGAGSGYAWWKLVRRRAARKRVVKASG